MIESYLLVICVTLEQEVAIKELFKLRAWKYTQVSRHKEETKLLDTTKDALSEPLHFGSVQISQTKDGTNTRPISMTFDPLKVTKAQSHGEDVSELSGPPLTFDPLKVTKAQSHGEDVSQLSGPPVTFVPLKVTKGEGHVHSTGEETGRFNQKSGQETSLVHECDEAERIKLDTVNNHNMGNSTSGSEFSGQPLPHVSTKSKELKPPISANKGQLLAPGSHSSGVTKDVYDKREDSENGIEGSTKCNVDVMSVSGNKCTVRNTTSSEVLKEISDEKESTNVVNVDSNKDSVICERSKMLKDINEMKGNTNLFEPSQAIDIENIEAFIQQNSEEGTNDISLKKSLPKTVCLGRKNNVPIKREKDRDNSVSSVTIKRDITSADEHLKLRPFRSRLTKRYPKRDLTRKRQNKIVLSESQNYQVKDNDDEKTEKKKKQMDDSRVKTFNEKNIIVDSKIEDKRSKRVTSKRLRQLNREARLQYSNRSGKQTSVKIKSIESKVNRDRISVELENGCHAELKDDFKCFDCARVFSKKIHFIKHIQRHKKHEFDCPECGKKFKNHRNMNAHRFQRSSQKKFICDICNHESNTACLLRIHKKSEHPVSATFYCHLCPKVIQTKSYLNKHLKLSHGIDDGTLECKVCGMKFKRPKLFQKHLETHNNSRNDLQCLTCDKIFKTKRDLRSHKRVHDERKHKCDECGKSFTTITKLAGHKRTHTGIKPFQCQLCNYKSTQAGNLRSHMKVHARFGEDKTESTKSKTRSTHDTSGPDDKLVDDDVVYGPSVSDDHHDWFPSKASYPPSQTVSMEPAGGYTQQPMLYANQGQDTQHYADQMNFHGDHHYGDKMQYIGSKEVSENLNPNTNMQGEMYTGDGSQYSDMVYNGMDGYSNSYTNQCYGSLNTGSYTVPYDPSVTNSGQANVLVDNTMKQYPVSNMEQSSNIHSLYQQQSGQALQQQDPNNHLHQQHPQHGQTLQQQDQANHLHHQHPQTHNSHQHHLHQQSSQIFEQQNLNNQNHHQHGPILQHDHNHHPHHQHSQTLHQQDHNNPQQQYPHGQTLPQQTHNSLQHHPHSQSLHHQNQINQTQHHHHQQHLQQHCVVYPQAGTLESVKQNLPEDTISSYVATTQCQADLINQPNTTNKLYKPEQDNFKYIL